MAIFTCTNCGAQSPSWFGKCYECEKWNTCIEENPPRSDRGKIQNPNTNTKQIRKPEIKNKEKVVLISVKDIKSDTEQRITSGIGELDRVLGGGIVKGSAVLIGGEPGIGKSTLMLQLANSLSRLDKVLYVTGEESPQQIKLRCERLGVDSPSLFLFPNTNLFEVEDEINNSKPGFVIIDSIQTLQRDDISSGSGSVSQIKECASYLIQIAKSTNIPLFIVGQVTKEGSIAGPRILEHMVDTVLYFEGEQSKQFRIIRATKNRFGSTNEVGIFEMTGKGLIEVNNPSKILIDESSLGSPGSVIAPAIEGTRPLLVEIQALTSYSKLASPRRVVTGLDYNKCAIIIGVLERKAGIKLSESDVYLSVASGMYVEEPAMDLPVAAALASCAKNKGLDPKTIIAGEIGLTGEIRAISNIEQRLKEAAKLGFKTAIIPKSNSNINEIKGIRVVGVSNIKEAIEQIYR